MENEFNKKDFLFLATIILLTIGVFGCLIYFSKYSGMTASMSSVRKLNTCGRKVIARVVDFDGVLATHSEVDAAKSICADLAADRKMLAQAKQDHNTVLARYFAKAISFGSYQKIAQKIDDSEKTNINGDENGVIGYVHDYHVYHDLYRHGQRDTFFNRYSIYAIYAPGGIMRRYRKMIKHQKKRRTACDGGKYGSLMKIRAARA
ncbi:hypothetical protein ACSSZE_03430 [Acidithiobacillus caldus]